MDILPEGPMLSGEPELPYEYVNSKVPWKKIIIIFAVVLIASIPFVLSLFHVKYLSPQSSELMETAYSQNQQSGVWGGLITGVKYLIKPVIHSSSTPTPTPPPASSPNIYRYTPQNNSAGQQTQIQDQGGNQGTYTYPSQDQNNQVYPTNVPDQGG